jgi:hypothetical protein
MMASALHSALTKNRTEELGHDVWEQFVVPPFYDRLDLHDARKPRVIIGGRGCGKTMLLRYLSHQSTFSPKRREIPPDALRHIGLYWRAQTQFASLMIERGLPADHWQVAFDHYLAVDIGLELLASLQSIARSRCSALTPSHLATLAFDALGSFIGLEHISFDALQAELLARRDQFELWVSNLRKVAEPIFLPGPPFLQKLIDVVRSGLPALADALFFVYIDEYENLNELHQRVINTHLKHSEIPLIFNIAIKRYGFQTKETLGSEAVSDIADYRSHDLEEYLQDRFSLFSAEILMLNLRLAGVEECDVDIDLLRDPNRLEERRTSAYRDSMLACARAVFPPVSEQEVAKQVFADPALRRLLQDRATSILKNRESSLPVDTFIQDDYPEASITSVALLHRQQLSPETIADQLRLMRGGEPNRFTGHTNWIHNNLFGCLLSLYAPFARSCPLYAGFDTFSLMSRGNVRHLLELCHQSLNLASRRIPAVTGMPVDLVTQAQAARQTSADLVGEIRSFGRFGHRLHAFTLALGSLFALAHSRPTQSEPEQSHFSIVGGSVQLSESDHSFLREAVKWSVLFEHKETKLKSQDAPVTNEYVLNPVYAPYFNITYRKKRKLELRTDDVAVLIHGQYDELRSLLKRYQTRWSVPTGDSNPTLFSHLEQ